MNETKNPAALADVATRRHAIAGIAITLGGLAVGSRALGRLEPAKRETPKPAANQPRTSLHYEANFKASPQRIYELLLDSKQFAALTGRPAEIDPKEAALLQCLGG